MFSEFNSKELGEIFHLLHENLRAEWKIAKCTKEVVVFRLTQFNRKFLRNN